MAKAMVNFNVKRQVKVRFEVNMQVYVSECQHSDIGHFIGHSKKNKINVKVEVKNVFCGQGQGQSKNSGEVQYTSQDQLVGQGQVLGEG